jgi:hypothetical protein
MSKLIDMGGERFGRLIVVSYARDRKWCCVCDCGARVEVRGDNLRKGYSRSCGCLARIGRKTHGMSRSREYRSWSAMKYRCSNPNHKSWKYYGGQGISFYEDWRAFESFFADTLERPPGCSLDRIDPFGNYEPGNVRWADAKQQVQNRRSRSVSATKKRRRVEQAERALPPLEDPPF